MGTSSNHVSEKCSSPIKKHSLLIEWTKVLMRDLSQVRYFQRELAHTGYKLNVT